MKIRVLNPVVGAYDISAVIGRKNFQTWLTNRGIDEWSFDQGEDIFYCDVPDTFDLTKLAQFGTVQKAIMEIVGWEDAS
jgi:hypothetical protein